MGLMKFFFLMTKLSDRTPVLELGRDLALYSDGGGIFCKIKELSSVTQHSNPSFSLVWLWTKTEQL